MSSSLDWPVYKRARKFDKRLTDGDISRIARIAAKLHREKFGKNPWKRIPDEDGEIGIRIYHYRDKGLELLDEVIREYIATNPNCSLVNYSHRNESSTNAPTMGETYVENADKVDDFLNKWQEFFN